MLLLCQSQVHIYMYEKLPTNLNLHKFISLQLQLLIANWIMHCCSHFVSSCCVNHDRPIKLAQVCWTSSQEQHYLLEISAVLKLIKYILPGVNIIRFFNRTLCSFIYVYWRFGEPIYFLTFVSWNGLNWYHWKLVSKYAITNYSSCC
jgi:hypothetical protein